MLAKVSGVELPVPRVTIMPRSRVAGIIQDHVLGESRYSQIWISERSNTDFTGNFIRKTYPNPYGSCVRF